MQTTPETKFHYLETRALAYLSQPLDAPGVVDIHRATVIMRVWRHPAFEPYQSWSLIKNLEVTAEEWLVRRITWERSLDFERSANPLKQAAFLVDSDTSPAIEVLDAQVDLELVNSFTVALNALTLPSLLDSQGIGLDGIANGMETQHGRVRLEWWCNGPASWRAFSEGTERLRVGLETAVLVNPAIKRMGFARRFYP